MPYEAIEVFLGRLDERMKNVEKTLQAINLQLETTYVKQAEFQPVRNIVYGLVALVMVAVVGALITLVI